MTAQAAALVNSHEDERRAFNMAFVDVPEPLQSPVASEQSFDALRFVRGLLFLGIIALSGAVAAAWLWGVWLMLKAAWMWWMN